jgi:oligopeptide transport system substrate-binding protein
LNHTIPTIFFAILLLTGCHRDIPADLVIVNGNEPESLDPAIVTGISEMRITKAIFEGLLRLDPKTVEPIPGLAERWLISADGISYTFYLRTNAVWSTGEPITSQDVLYSWRRTLDPATAADYAGQLFYIKNAELYYSGKLKDPAQIGIQAIDDHVVRVQLEHPLAFFLELCTFPAMAIVPRNVIEKYGDRWLAQRPLPSSGPYELIAWRLNDKVRLGKNRRYWDAANTQSDLIDLLPIGSPNVALNLYQTGVADIVWDKDLIPLELLDVLTNRIDFHHFDYLGTFFYRFNVTRKPLDNPLVRKAFALATDRVRIVRKLALGGEKPAFHYVPGGVAHYQSPPGLPFEPAQARKLLADAGFPGGKGFPRFEYAFFSAPGGGGKMQPKIAIELQQMWRDELGVEIGLRQIERKIFYNSQSRLDYDLSASSWIGDYNDANTFLDMFLKNSGNNRTGWKNDRYDNLVDQANRETDIKHRAELLREAESILIAEEVPIVPLYFYAGFNYFRKVEGIYQNILDEHPLQSIRKIASQRKSR